ncbi:MAG TPA: TonB-dependent receptor [Rhodothermales bacterium]|nr:TonB-dependent receptor [Rhodothermales bacterium]
MNHCLYRSPVQCALLVALLLGLPWIGVRTAHAQTKGIIEGVVTNVETQERLPGVQVYLENTTLGVVANAEGRYRLEAPAGSYTLVARFVGFETQRVAVTVEAESITQRDVALAEGTVLLQDVVVSATGERQSKAEISASIGTIDKDAIDEAKPGHPSEIMGRIPGVWVNQTAGEGHMTAIRQPLTTNAVYLFLENGVPTRSTGFFNHNALYEINIPQAEGIEVIKGPGTALYGSDAIGGVINVTSQSAPVAPEVEASVEGGSYGFGRLLLSGGTTVGNSGLRLDVNATRSDGWREATEYNRQSATIRWDLRLPGASRLRTVAAFSNIDQEPAGSSAISQEDFAADPTINYTPISFRKVQAFRLSSAYERFTENANMSLTPYFRFSTMDLLPNWSLSFDPSVWETQNYSIGLLAKYRYDFDPMDARIITGADLDLSPGERIETKVAATREGKEYTSYTREEALYDYDVTYRQAAPYIHAEIEPVSGLRFNGGLRLDVLGYDYKNNLSVVTEGSHRRAASTTRSFTHLSPKLGVTYQISPRANVFAAYRHAFRAPSESELFRQGSTSNTLELQPLKADNYEVGLRTQLVEQVELEVSAYTMTKTDDIVDLTDENGIRQSTNAGETRHRGIETLLIIKPVHDLELRGSFSYAQHTYEEWRISATTDLSGNEIEVAPREVSNVSATYKPSFLPGSSLSLTWDHLGGYWMDPENSAKYGGYDVFSLHAAYDITRDISVFGRVINLTDELYAERATYNAFRGEEFAPGLPRTVYIGLQYNLSR